MIHVHIDVPEYEAAKYAFQVLLAAADVPVTFHRASPAGLAPEAVLITYSRAWAKPGHNRHLFLYASRRLWDHYGSEASSPPSPLPRVPVATLGVRPSARLQDPLVVPYMSELVPQAAEVRGSSIVTGLDLVASTLFWITRYEENLIAERDEFGRVPQKLLRAIQEGLTGRPLVDEYSELLMAWLEMLASGVPVRRPPFRVLLTHDVDTGIGVRGFAEHAENGLRTFYREAVRGRRLRTGWQGLGHWTLRGLGVRDEAAFFRDIVRLDADVGFSSLFFLMANGTHPKDASYDIGSDGARRVIEAIREAGGSIGLHVGLDAHKIPGQLHREWEHLQRADPRARPVSRSHFLAFHAPVTWRQLVALGFTADSTLGFSHHMGFRCGTCRGFRPFDVERRERLPIWELPMALMDVNLFQGPDDDEAVRLSEVRNLIESVKAHGGCLVVNWHNVSYFGHYRRTYRAILDHLQGAQAASLDRLPAENESVIW